MADKKKFAITGGILAIGFIAIAFLPGFHIGILTTIGIFALLGLSVGILAISGQISIGHAAFMGIAAYTSAALSVRLGWPPMLSLLAGTALAGLSGLFIGSVTAPLRGHFLALATLSWGVAVAVIFRAAEGITGGASGFGGIESLTILGLSFADERRFAALVFVVVCATVLGGIALLRSRMGRAVLALEEHEQMAEAFGVRIAYLRIQVLVLSTSIAGLAGGLYAHHIRFISPSVFDLNTSIKALTIAYLGGEMHPAGAIIGSAVTELMNWFIQAGARLFGAGGQSLEQIIFGVLLILIMVLFPGGVWQRIEPLFSQRKIAVGPGQLLASRQASGAASLSVHGVSVQFGGLKAVTELSFEVTAGELVALIGPNGAGKSTAFNAITGLIEANAGVVRLNGSPLKCHRSALVGMGLARTFQHSKLLGSLTVLENVMLGAFSRTRAGLASSVFGLDGREEGETAATAMQCLTRLGIAHLATNKADTLSLGQLRLVEVARALAADPVVLLLDEPAAGLRKEERMVLARLLKQLKAEGLAILLVEHDMDLVMGIVDRVIVMERGVKIADGSAEQVCKNPVVIEAYLGSAA